MKNAPQKFWRYLSPSKTMILELIINDRSIVEDGDIAREFNNFFHSVFESSASDVQGIAEEQPVGSDSATMGEICISEEGVFSLLLELNEKVWWTR